MKKLLAILVVLVMAISAVALVACQIPNNKNNGGAFEIESAEQFYAYGAASVATLIDVATTQNNGTSIAKMSLAADTNNASEGQTSGNGSTDGTDATQPTTPDSGSQSGNGQDGNGQNGNGAQNGNGNNTSNQLTDEQLNKVNQYLALVESLLSGGSINTSVETSDRTEYQYKEIVSFKDMTGATISYTLYYNETEMTNGTSPRDNDRDDDDDDDRWENDNEVKQNYRIDGVLIINEQEYAVEGFSQSESETNESEREMTFKAYTGENSYIIMTSEMSTETEFNGTETENEITYSLYTNGKLTERTTLEQENENGETELKMSVLKDGVTNVLYFEEEVENKVRKLSVRASIDGDNVNFKVWITTNDQGEEVYRYQFNDGYKDCHRDFWDD